MEGWLRSGRKKKKSARIGTTSKPSEESLGEVFWLGGGVSELTRGKKRVQENVHYPVSRVTWKKKEKK